jgi:hypothetical protein
LLGLNLESCCELRLMYAEEFLAGHISADYLERRAPFVASELARRGLKARARP